MGLLLAVITGGVIWVVLWAIGFKSFDAWLIMIVLLLLAAAARLIAPFLPGSRRRPERSPRLR
jgi:Mn2+/Fe2+ NRAMP family transporter